ncbi:DUF2065 domain-containing protein [Halieaceae bacterium IMCC14734]|uniref:DUF2065 domain-containing protein n=1 Tax=Candidatus Litorirhabdus singularis TaxID=2518993 RepID=A0ABT3TKA3_9GAMM|nr:DUF2065 domain-containing protein [Candidatus Litorirhabdus singularis]MCX2982734.1 DUF2065 domain-containing protein [Candidatus Litorirhabdus singularis]
MDVWQQLAVAVAMVFILEGIMPFISPGRWRNLVKVMAELDNRTMRAMGLFSMMLGLALLYLVH